MADFSGAAARAAAGLTALTGSRFARVHGRILINILVTKINATLLWRGQRSLPSANRPRCECAVRSPGSL
jgi:hypothetical protein